MKIPTPMEPYQDKQFAIEAFKEALDGNEVPILEIYDSNDANTFHVYFFEKVQEYGVVITFYNATFLPGCNLFDYTIRKSPGLRTTSVSTKLCNHYLLTKTCYKDPAFRIEINELLKESYNLSLIKDLVKPVVSEDNYKKKMGKYDIWVEAGRCTGIPIKANFYDDPNKVKSSVSTYALSDLLFESKKASSTFASEQRNKFRHACYAD